MIEFDAGAERGAFILDVKFKAERGCTALFGPSGSGKTMILRIIAGLDKPDRGRITINGETVFDSERKIFVPPHKRRVGLVFQDSHLFPHLNVHKNLGYARKFNDPAPGAMALDGVAEALGISHLLERIPAKLSGGEKQRVAIGRALLSSPSILLMDEPLAALDMGLRLEILPLIERVRDRFDVPILYVSHAIDEVSRLADRVVRIARGRVQTQGTAADILAEMGEGGSQRFDAVSFVRAKVSKRDADYGVTYLEHAAGAIVVPGLVADNARDVRIAIRATNVTIALARPQGLSVRTMLEGRVASVTAGAGPVASISIELKGGDIVYALATRLAVEELKLAPGVPVFALVKAVAIDERGIAAM